jgi:heterotetrameric sarcosine oxidase delta subunit
VPPPSAIDRPSSIVKRSAVFRIPCPHCGPRDATEFRHQGESRERPDPRSATREQWRAYLYEKDNVAGWTRETWYHGLGCRRFITVERDTVTNEARPITASEPPAADGIHR